MLFLQPVIEYAKWLGMDLEKDKDLYWVAREGLMVSIPHCQTYHANAQLLN